MVQSNIPYDENSGFGNNQSEGTSTRQNVWHADERWLARSQHTGNPLHPFPTHHLLHLRHCLLPLLVDRKRMRKFVGLVTTIVAPYVSHALLYIALAYQSSHGSKELFFLFLPHLFGFPFLLLFQ